MLMNDAKLENFEIVCGHKTLLANKHNQSTIYDGCLRFDARHPDTVFKMFNDILYIVMR